VHGQYNFGPRGLPNSAKIQSSSNYYPVTLNESTALTYVRANANNVMQNGGGAYFSNDSYTPYSLPEAVEVIEDGNEYNLTENNVLINDIFYYKIYQYVPRISSDDYKYSRFRFVTYIPEGIEYQNECNMYESFGYGDGSEVVSQVSSDNVSIVYDTSTRRLMVTVRADLMNTTEFYDTCYVVKIKVKATSSFTTNAIHTQVGTYHADRYTIEHHSNASVSRTGIFKIVSRLAATDYCMTVESGSTSDGANVRLYEDSTAENRRWKIMAEGDGCFSLTNIKTSGCMRVNTSTNNVEQQANYSWSVGSMNPDNVLWRIEEVANNKYIIKSKVTDGSGQDLYLTVDSAANTVNAYVTTKITNSEMDTETGYSKKQLFNIKLYESTSGIHTVDDAVQSDTNSVYTHYTMYHLPIIVRKNDTNWENSGMKVAIYSGETMVYEYNGTESLTNAKYNTDIVGPYEIKAYKGTSAASYVNYNSGYDINENTSLIIDYYDLTLTVGTGILSTTGGGTYLSNQLISINANIKTGYTWKNWTIVQGNSPTSPTTKNTTVRTSKKTNLKANATINTYEITYNLSGGVLGTPNPESYTVTTPTFILNTPSKSGYIFTGWTGSNGTSPQKIVTIPLGSYGNKNYTANWEPNRVSITIRKDDAIWNESGMNVALYQNNVLKYSYSQATKNGSVVTWTGVEDGVYDIYAGKKSGSESDLKDTGKTIVVGENNNNNAQ